MLVLVLVLVLVLMLIAQAVDAGHTQVLVWRLQETEGSFCKGRRGFIFYNKSEVILWIMITMVLINYLILVGNPFFFRSWSWAPTLWWWTRVMTTSQVRRCTNLTEDTFQGELHLNSLNKWNACCAVARSKSVCSFYPMCIHDRIGWAEWKHSCKFSKKLVGNFASRSLFLIFHISIFTSR